MTIVESCKTARTTFLAGVALAALGLLPGTLVANAGEKMKVQVVNAIGTGVKGVAVHAYKASSGKCKCQQVECAIDPVSTQVSGNGGHAEFSGLDPMTTYTFCIEDRCDNKQPGICLTPAEDCNFVGKCTTFTTNKKGGGNTSVRQ